MNYVYLDHAATTALDAQAFDAMRPYLDERFGNASEPHAAGRAARVGLEDARRTVAELTGAEPEQVVFTSGGTEADNQAVMGLAGEPPGRLVASAVEHPAVREPALALERRGFEVAWAPVDASGVVDVDALEQLVRPGDRLCAVMWANNVTGVIQPVAEAAEVCAAADVPLHVDAVQAAASLVVDFGSSGADTMAFSAHKLHGPKGVGCLLTRDPGRTPPLILGGGQEHGLRSGTENVAGVVGFAAALEAGRSAHDERRANRELLERSLPPGVRVVSAEAGRLPGHALLLVEGIRAELLVLALDRAGFGVAAGSACASGEAEPSYVLLAQGMSKQDARSVIRVSLGLSTTSEDVRGFVAALTGCLEQLRAGALAL
ncbi:MAG: cysteine desulfurase family protein [Gaiellales bacterium]